VTAGHQAGVSAQMTTASSEEVVYVEAWQVLVRLQNAAQKAAVTQAKAQFEAAQAVLRPDDLQRSTGTWRRL
jgi:multidrug efflux pump subunit AcrA (membrane-fusion protein)